MNNLRRMRKVLVGLGMLVLLGLLLLGGLSAYVAARLRSTDLEKTFLEQARAALGTEVRLSRMDVSFLSGVTLHGLTVENPPPFTGQLMTAEGFVLRYRLRPLLSGRVEVGRLALEKPRLTLAMDARGRFNYEQLGGGAPSGAAQAASGALPLRIVLRSLAVDAQVLMTDQRNARLLAVDDANFQAFESPAGPAGRAIQDRDGERRRCWVRGVRAPLTLRRTRSRSRPCGRRRRAAAIERGPGGHFRPPPTSRSSAASGSVADAKSPATIQPRGPARFEGKGGLATLRAAPTSIPAAENNRVLALHSSVLQVPELANPDFKTCHLDFQQNGSRFATPVLDLTGDGVRLSGSGSLDIETSSLNYQLTLALAPRLFAKVTRPELRAGFKQQPNGFAALDFRLTGTTLEPKTDILARLGEAAAKGLIQDQVNRLINRKKKSSRL